MIIVNSDNLILTVKILQEINLYILSNSPDDFEQSLGGVVRDYAMLEFLVEELNDCSDSFERAAIALQKIAIRHPFIQGNKRTAFAIANILLLISGHELKLSGEMLNHDIRELICSEWSIDTLKKWIVKNVVNIRFD